MKGGLQRFCALVFIVVSGLWSQQCLAEGFVTGTLVKVPDGYVPIETLKVGDVVCCLGAENRPTQSLVTATTTHKGSSQVALKINNTLLLLSPTQKFCAYKPHELLSEWLVAAELSQNNFLVALNKRASPEDLPIVSGLFVEYPIQECCVVAHDEPQIFHTISVASFKNYCVTESDIVVHNYTITIPVLTYAFNGLCASLAIPSGPAVCAVFAAWVVLELIENAYPGSTSSINVNVCRDLGAGMRQIAGEGSERGEWWESNVDARGNEIPVQADRLKKHIDEGIKNAQREAERNNPPPPPQKLEGLARVGHNIVTETSRGVENAWNYLIGKGYQSRSGDKNSQENGSKKPEEKPKDNHNDNDGNPPPPDGENPLPLRGGDSAKQGVVLSSEEFKKMTNDPLGYMYKQQQEEGQKNYEAGRNDPLGLNKELEKIGNCIAENGKEQDVFLEGLGNLIKEARSEENKQLQGRASSDVQAGLQKAPALHVNNGDDARIKNSTQDSGKQDTPHNTNNDNDDDNNPPDGDYEMGGEFQECLNLLKKSPEAARQWLSERGLNSPEEILEYLEKNYPRTKECDFEGERCYLVNTPEPTPTVLPEAFLIDPSKLGKWEADRRESYGDAYVRYVDRTIQLIKERAMALGDNAPLLATLAVLAAVPGGAPLVLGYVAGNMAVSVAVNHEELAKKLAVINYQLHHDRPEFCAELTAFAVEIVALHSAGKAVGSIATSVAEVGSISIEQEIFAGRLEPLAGQGAPFISVAHEATILGQAASEITTQEVGGIARGLPAVAETPLASTSPLSVPEIGQISVGPGGAATISQPLAAELGNWLVELTEQALPEIQSLESAVAAGGHVATLVGISVLTAQPEQATQSHEPITVTPAQTNIVLSVLESVATEQVPTIVQTAVPTIVQTAVPTVAPSAVSSVEPVLNSTLYVSSVSSTKDVPVVGGAVPLFGDAGMSQAPSASVLAFSNCAVGASAAVGAVSVAAATVCVATQPGGPSGPPPGGSGSPSGAQPSQKILLPTGEIFLSEIVVFRPDGSSFLIVTTQSRKTFLCVISEMPTTLQEKLLVVAKELEAAREAAAINPGGMYTSYAQMTQQEFMIAGELHAPLNAPNGSVTTMWDKPNKPVNGWKTIETFIDQSKGIIIENTKQYRWPAIKSSGPHSGKLVGNIEEFIEKKDFLNKVVAGGAEINIHVYVI